MTLSVESTDLLLRRAKLLGPNVSTFYQELVHIVRGEGVWLWDAEGRKYLDCYNNVPHVQPKGHRGDLPSGWHAEYAHPLSA